jgi:serine/threonine protein kinase
MTERPPLDPSYLPKGTRVGAYEIVDKLGSGGFGWLWKVRRDGKPYALKIGQHRLSELDAEDRKNYEARLDREIAALKTLHHPNIVRVRSFDWWPDLEDGFPYLVMDFVDGQPLPAWRKHGAPSFAKVCDVFEKLAAAIEHMHSLGIYHRDLKGDNVLVRGDGDPVVIDFGVARPQLTLNLTRAAIVGTITHYAPEYACFCDSAAFSRGEPFEWKATTDLHAIGYMLYEVLTGRRPFPRNSAALRSEAAMFVAIKKEIPAHPADVDPRVPRSLGDIAMALLKKDPGERPQSAREFADRLRAAREGGTGDRAWADSFDVARDSPVQAGAPEDEGDRILEAAEKLFGDEGQEDQDPAAPDAMDSGPGVTSQHGFDDPSLASPLAFDSGDAAAPAVPPSPSADPIPSAIREAKARLAASAPNPGPGRLAIGGGVLVAGIFAIIVAARIVGPEERPRTTLNHVPVREPAGSMRPGSETAVLMSEPAPLVPGRDPPQSADAAPIGEALARESGHPRTLPDSLGVYPVPDPAHREPQVRPASSGPQDKARATVASRDPPWLHRSTRLASRTSAPRAPAPKARGVPLGTHMKAKLLTNLDSRTIANGPVEAVLTLPVLVRGEVALPARTLVYGTATESSGRFNLHFTRLRLPDDTEVEFEGLALARDDGKPGLAAARRVETEPERQPSLGAEIAKGTGNILLDTIAGGVGHDVARNAGRAALNHERPVERGSTWALLLDSGVAFDVWVERAF